MRRRQGRWRHKEQREQAVPGKEVIRRGGRRCRSERQRGAEGGGEEEGEEVRGRRQAQTSEKTDVRLFGRLPAGER